MTTIIIDPTTDQITAPTTGQRASLATSVSRRRFPAWITDVLRIARQLVPEQRETPSDQAIATLSPGDRLGERY